MIIAVLADIHANLQALDAVIADARSQGARQFVVAGDYVIGGPSPVEVLNRLAELTPHVIQGNHEQYLLDRRAGKGPGWEHHHQTASMQWTYERMGPAQWAYIEGLPAHLSLKFEGISIRVVHGSPWHSRGRLVPGENDEDIDRAAQETIEDVLVCAHTHLPWSGFVQGKLLLNPGSVGIHFDTADGAAKYALLHIEDGCVRVQPRSVAYDMDALWRDIRGSGLLDCAPHWTMLTFMSVRDGYEYCMPFLLDAKAERHRRGLPDEGFLSDAIWEAVWERWTERLPQLRF